MTAGVWQPIGGVVHDLVPEALGLNPEPPRAVSPLVVTDACHDTGCVTVTGYEARRGDPLRGWHADPAYRLLARWHRESWLASMRSMRARMARWTP